MSERPGVANVVAALNVRRQARRGFGVGVGFALVVFVLFVYLPGSNRPELFYVALAFVLAVSLGLLATAAFVAVAAYRLAGELDPIDPADLERP